MRPAPLPPIVISKNTLIGMAVAFVDRRRRLVIFLRQNASSNLTRRTEGGKERATHVLTLVKFKASCVYYNGEYTASNVIGRNYSTYPLKLIGSPIITIVFIFFYFC